MATLEILEERLWIWCGTLTGVCLLLLFSIIWLCSKVNKMQGYIKSTVNSNQPNTHIPTHSYGNPRIVPGEDLAKRGYSVHTAGSEVGTTYFSDEVVSSSNSRIKDKGTRTGNSRNRENSLDSVHYSGSSKNKGISNPNFMY